MAINESHGVLLNLYPVIGNHLPDMITAVLVMPPPMTHLAWS